MTTALKWPMKPYGMGSARIQIDELGWLPADERVAVPWIRYSGWYRGVLRRGRIGSGSHFRNGIWQPLLENGEIKIYLTCIIRGCRAIHSFGFGEDSFDIYVERSGYHSGTCVQCDDCQQHFWCFFQGWEKLLELPIKEI